MKFRKKPVYIDAWQWFKLGDVPEVTGVPRSIKGVSEGQRNKLGWVDTPQGGHVVYPGDWVIIDMKGQLTTCNPISFGKQYEIAETKILPRPRQFGRSA